MTFCRFVCWRKWLDRFVICKSLFLFQLFFFSIYLSAKTPSIKSQPQEWNRRSGEGKGMEGREEMWRYVISLRRLPKGIVMPAGLACIILLIGMRCSESHFIHAALTSIHVLLLSSESSERLSYKILRLLLCQNNNEAIIASKSYNWILLLNACVCVCARAWNELKWVENARITRFNLLHFSLSSLSLCLIALLSRCLCLVWECSFHSALCWIVRSLARLFDWCLRIGSSYFIR